MIPNYYALEQLAQAHRQDLMREAERERLLVQLPQSDHHVPLHFLARPARFLRELCLRLRPRGVRREQPIYD
jgi:hypothetical protein